MSVRTGGQLGPANSTLAWSIAGGGLSDFTDFFPGGTTDFSTLGPFDYASSIRSAFTAWSAVANLQFIQVLDPGTEFGGLFGTFPDIRIGAGTLDTGFPGFEALGTASFPFTANKGYVWINSASGPFWNPQTLFMVTLHELGHSLGLDHETGATAVMNPAYNAAITGLQPDDIAGIQGIYGAQDNLPPIYTMPTNQANLTIVTSLPSLTVNGNSLNNVIAGTSLNETFFGNGGNDTIDGSSGFDTAGFSGNRANYSIVSANGTVSVTDLRSGSPDGTDTLLHIDLLQFADRMVALNDFSTSRAERFFDSATGDHFYTLSPAEADQIRATLPTYHDEGAPWGTPDKGADTIDVFRVFDAATGAHFLTTSTAERDHVIATLPSYHYEGIAFEAYTAPSDGTLTLERFFNTPTCITMRPAPLRRRIS